MRLYFSSESMPIGSDAASREYSPDQDNDGLKQEIMNSSSEGWSGIPGIRPTGWIRAEVLFDDDVFFMFHQLLCLNKF